MSLWSGNRNAPSTTDSNGRRTALAGRDLVAGGTWLGVDASNKVVLENDSSSTVDIFDGAETENSTRWIALTNFLNDHDLEKHDKTSRGRLLCEYLGMDVPNLIYDNECTSAKAFVESVCNRGDEYNGFSMLVGDDTGVYYCTNRGQYPPSTPSRKPTDTPIHKSSFYGPLSPGIYGLSNGILDSPWPKVQRGIENLHHVCNNTTLSGLDLHESLMKMLRDEWRPEKNQYPDKKRSSIFVPEFNFDGKKYGTRSSTTVLIERDGGKVSVLERTWLTDDDRWFELVPMITSDITKKK